MKQFLFFSNLKNEPRIEFTQVYDLDVTDYAMKEETKKQKTIFILIIGGLTLFSCMVYKFWEFFITHITKEITAYGIKIIEQRSKKTSFFLVIVKRKDKFFSEEKDKSEVIF